MMEKSETIRQLQSSKWSKMKHYSLYAFPLTLYKKRLEAVFCLTPGWSANATINISRGFQSKSVFILKR